MVALVNDGLHLESSNEGDRVAFGAQLKDAISHFTVDFIPHMKEEEEVSSAHSSHRTSIETVQSHSSHSWSMYLATLSALCACMR